MSIEQVFVLLIAVVTAVACAIPGVFLVLRRRALMIDAIGHAVLPGIVIAFMLVADINSPFLVIGAALMGIFTAFLCESIARTGLIKEDSAIVIVFPFLFSIGVLLMSKYLDTVHLCEDSVMYGNIAFAPFQQLTIGGQSLGPQALWLMTSLLLLNIAFAGWFYKELKISTFDPALAVLSGFSPVLIGYLLIFVVSLTAVGAFQVVGSVLIIALMVIPPATAYLLTHELQEMLLYSVLIGVATGILGFLAAILLDTSISGSMASVAGLLFAATFIGTQATRITAKPLRPNQTVS